MSFPRGSGPAGAALLVVLGLVPPAGAQQGPVEGRAASPRLMALAARVALGESGAIDGFWRELEQHGAPLVEADPATPGHSIVTFVARGGPGVLRIRLDSNLTVLLAAGSLLPPDSLGWLERLGETDVWYRSFRLRNDTRVPYRFEIRRAAGEPVLQVDSMNANVWEPKVASLRASILELPGAPAQPWRNPSGEEGAGDWDELSAAGRSVYVYTPRAWHADRESHYPVLVGLGAFGHGIGMRVDRMVDELIDAGRLPPVIVALVDVTNDDEHSRYRSTATYVIDELLPQLRARYHVTADPGDVVISGTSRRGVVAALLAFEHPEAFGNVLSLSGSYYWRPQGEAEFEWVPRLYASAARRPVRFYIAAGELETFVTPGNRGHYLVATNRHMRDVLRARGYAVEYVEFNGVHSGLNWQDGLAAGLVHLLRR